MVHCRWRFGLPLRILWLGQLCRGLSGLLSDASAQGLQCIKHRLDSRSSKYVVSICIATLLTRLVFFMLFGGIFVGRIFDNYGPRHLLLGGTFLHVFGLMMTSISKKYYQLLLSQAICSSIGASMVFYPAFTCVSPDSQIDSHVAHIVQASTWFFEKRGAALGLVVAGSSLGGVIFPIMIIHLLPEVGFGWTLRICAFLILALLIFANMVVRSRIPPTRRPFSLMSFIRPLKLPSFALLTAAVFFFYCKSGIAAFPTPAHFHRGNVRTLYVHCCGSAIARHVSAYGQLSCTDFECRKVSAPASS